MLCRFYGFSIAEVMAMTLRQFSCMLSEMGEILRMETGGEKKEASLTGDAGFRLAQTVFPRGRK